IPIASIMSAVLVAIIPAMRGLAPSGFRKVSERERDITIVFLAVIAGAVLAASGANVLFGKVIQGYHFTLTFLEVLAISLYLTMALTLMSVRLKPAWILLLLGVLAAYPTLEMVRNTRFEAGSKTDQQRVWQDLGFDSIPNYRNDLVLLLREL